SPWIARHWTTTTKKVVQHSLPWIEPGEWPSFVETAPDELYAYSKDVVVTYDGTSWKLLGKTSKRDNIAWAKRAAKGELWVRLENGNIERSTPTGFIAVTTPEPFDAIDGIDIGAPWAVGKSGKLYKRDGESWTEVRIPPPSFGLATAVK